MSVKLILRKKKNKDGTLPDLLPLTLRIIKDRKTSFIYLGEYLKESDWNEKEQRVKRVHPNSTRLNNYIIQKLAEASDVSLELKTKKPGTTAQAVKQKIKPEVGLTFFAIATLYLDQLQRAGKYNQHTADKPRIGHFKAFLNNRDIAFSDVTVAVLERFRLYLKSSYKTQAKKPEDAKPLGERSIVNHLATIRSVFSKAAKEGVIEKDSSPFGEGKIQIIFPPSNKIGLTPEEVQRIEHAALPERSFQDHARNLWLFSFYLAGMRVSDVLRLRWSDIQDNRLHYAMGKNKKPGSLKLPEKAFVIVMKYEAEKSNKHDFIFPDLKRLDAKTEPFFVQRAIAFTTSRLDKYLRVHVAPAASIEKTLTMHIARHTFGNISGNKIAPQMLQKLYRHSSIVTTIGYQSNFIHQDADDALHAVLSF